MAQAPILLQAEYPRTRNVDGQHILLMGDRQRPE